MKPRPTSNYLIPTVLFGLFLLVLIPGLNYYIATVSSGDQPAHFVTDNAERDDMIVKLGESVKALEGKCDPSQLITNGGFYKEVDNVRFDVAYYFWCSIGKSIYRNGREDYWMHVLIGCNPKNGKWETVT
eukprot:748591_1